MSESLYQSFYKQSPYCVHEFDDYGNIISMNEAGLRMLGLQEEREILGVNINDMIKEADQAKIWTYFNQASIDGIKSEFEVEINDGQIMSSNFIPLCKKENGKYRVTSTSKQYTKFRKNELDLQQIKDHFSSIMDNAPIAVTIVDRDYNIKYINQNSYQRLKEYFTFSYSIEEAIGRKLQDYSSLEFLKEQKLKMGLCFSGESCKSLSLYGEQWILSYYFPLYNNQEISSIAIICQDITRVKKLDEHKQELMNSLVEQNMDLEEYAYHVSHDLREPARMVSACAQMLENSIVKADSKKHLKNIVDNTQIMENLISNLLIKTDNVKELKVSLSEILKKLEQAFTLLTAKRLNINISFKEEIFIRIENYILERLLTNIINNTIEYNDNSTVNINIIVKDDHSKYKFTFEDNSRGFSKGDEKKIFEPLGGNLGEVQGTGLGLSICKKIITHVNGHIGITYPQANKGMIYFSLPKKIIETN